MTTSKACRIDNFIYKIYIVLTLTLIFSIGTTISAYASELTDTSAGAAGNDAAAADLGTAAEDSDDTLDEGIALDKVYEDGQDGVYYIDPDAETEEPVITDIPEEDAEETVDPKAETVTEDAEGNDETDPVNKEDKSEKEDSKKQDTKAQSTKAQAKSTKTAAVKKPSYSEADLRLLSGLIYAEAGGQSYNGMLAVANVVLNRAKSSVYWHANTVKEVIYDRKWSVQFSVTIKNKKTGLSSLDKALKYYDTRKFTGGNPEAEKKAMERAVKAAKAALEGKNNIGNYLCFTNKRGTSSIKKKYPDYKIIGDHIFYRTK